VASATTAVQTESTDEIPSTLMPVLSRFAQEQLLVLVDTARILDDHSDGIGAADLFDIKQQVRLKRENNRLFPDRE